MSQISLVLEKILLISKDIYFQILKDQNNILDQIFHLSV